MRIYSVCSGVVKGHLKGRDSNLRNIISRTPILGSRRDMYAHLSIHIRVDSILFFRWGTICQYFFFLFCQLPSAIRLTFTSNKVQQRTVVWGSRFCWYARATFSCDVVCWSPCICSHVCGTGVLLMRVCFRSFCHPAAESFFYFTVVRWRLGSDLTCSYTFYCSW